MPLSKARPSPRPSATSSFRDNTNRSGETDDRPRFGLGDDHENIHRKKRQHGRQWSYASQRTTSVIPIKSDAETQNKNDENETVDEFGAIDAVPSASTGGRFKRPDFLLQGLLARAKNRVRDRSERGEKGDEDVSQGFDTQMFLPDEALTATMYQFVRHDCTLSPMGISFERHCDIRPLRLLPISANPVSCAMAIVGQVMPLSIDSPELAPQWAQFGAPLADGCHDSPMSCQFSILPSFFFLSFFPL
jgi:hypothetical protein